MPKYLETKDGSLESAVLEAVSPAQQAAIAISKKKKAGKPGYDDEGKSLKSDVEFEVPEEIEKEGVADFIGAASKAAAAGKKEFKFGDKTYPVKIKKDVAKKVASKMEEVQEETLAMRTAKHISDMWSEAATKKEVKSEEEDDEKKEDGKTMTGKPMTKVNTKVVEKD